MIDTASSHFHQIETVERAEAARSNFRTTKHMAASTTVLSTHKASERLVNASGQDSI